MRRGAGSAMRAGLASVKRGVCIEPYVGVGYQHKTTIELL